MKTENRHINFQEPEGMMLLRYIKDTASNEEKSYIEAWLEADENNKRILLQTARIYYANNASDGSQPPSASRWPPCVSCGLRASTPSPSRPSSAPPPSRWTSCWPWAARTPRLSWPTGSPIPASPWAEAPLSPSHRHRKAPLPCTFHAERRGLFLFYCTPAETGTRFSCFSGFLRCSEAAARERS